MKPGAPTKSAQSDAALTAVEKIGVLFEEYKAMYGLAEFRLASLDRRATLAWVALGAFLASFEAVSEPNQRAFLIGIPVAVFWLFRTTVNHARSFEDAIRRIDQIERAINVVAGEVLLTFQSRHPSRGRDVGGRTGRETVLTVLVTGIAMLVACGYLFMQHIAASDEIKVAYSAYIAIVAFMLVAHVRALRCYRYQAADESPPSPEPPDGNQPNS